MQAAIQEQLMEEEMLAALEVKTEEASCTP